MAVTIKDIAQAAGVSYSTVSRALNGLNKVEEGKRIRIVALAKEMGYVPNVAAVSLKKNCSMLISLYLDQLEPYVSPYALQCLLEEFQREVKEAYSGVIKDWKHYQPGSLNPAFCDGILAFSMLKFPAQKILCEEASQKGIPVVLINQKADYPITSVVIDQVRAMEEAMTYLLERGHRKIVVLEGEKSRPATVARHEGWQKAIKKWGMDPREIPCYFGDYSLYSARQLVPQILSHAPSAVLCFNDEMACGLIAAFRVRGIRCPEDISVLGFDNWDLPHCNLFRLTTVDRNMREMARISVRELLRQIQKPSGEVQEIQVQTRIAERGSVRNLQEHCGT